MPIDLPITALPVKKVLSEIYSLLKVPTKKKFKNYSTARNIKKIYDHLRKLGK